MKNFKSFFPYAVALALTFFSFLCLSIPYLRELAFFGQNWGGQINIFITGYGALSLWGLGWTGIVISIIQLLELLTMISILIFAIIGISCELLAKAKGQETKPVLSFVLMILFLVNFGFDFLVLVFVIVMSIINGVSLSAGLFLKLFFDIAAIIGLLLGKYFFNDKPTIKSRPITFKESKIKNTEDDRNDEN